jgi:hypothetical protein
MITKKELLEKKGKVDKLIDHLFDVKFDHFAIKVPNKAVYEEMCENFGKLQKEVFQSGRNVATVIGELGTFEIMMPKESEEIKDAYISHLGYVSNNMDGINENSTEIISKLELGNTKIIFVIKEGEIIQFRNVPLRDYEAA